VADRIKPYWDELLELSREIGVDLLTAFRRAGISERSFYRARTSGRLRHETASRVEEAIRTLGREAKST